MKAKMLNGEFEICPVCGETMVKRHNLNGFNWVCLFGCGYIKEAQKLNKD